MPKPQLAPVNYTVAETCTRLGLSRTTVHRHEKAGNLTPVRIGGRTFYPAAQVEAVAEHGAPIPSGSREAVGVADVEEAARRLVARTCAEQGLPETVEDPEVIAAVAEIVRKAVR